MELLPLTIKDKTLFTRYAKERPHSLSSYAFENIFIWRAHFEILWSVIGGRLCIFFKDPVGCFMILPPLGGLDAHVISECFDVMNGFNDNTEVSRIESIEEDDLSFFKENNFRIFEKSKDYIVSSQEMSGLKGERFKHKRNLVNFFLKTHNFCVRRYSAQDKEKVEELYASWMASRMEKNNDLIYQAMLEDSKKALCEELESFADLDFSGFVVEVDGRVRAFTSGFPVTRNMFCVNFEIADLSFKGISQFIFNHLAQELASDFHEINIMDDSGIENIRATKLSYKPVRTPTSYTALMKD